MISFGRVTLRRVEPADYSLIQAWQNDPEIFPRMDYQKPFSLDDIRRAEEHGAEKEWPFVIEADGKPIGRCGLFGIRWRDGWGALYIFIGAKDTWGKGYGKDAIRALLGYAFDTLNLRMVQLYSLGDNVVMSITREEHARSLES